MPPESAPEPGPILDWGDRGKPGTILGWVTRLGKALDERSTTITRWDDYYNGKHRLAFASEKFKDAFGGLFREWSDNYCALVVDAVEERLQVEGFRFKLGEGTEEDAAQLRAGDALAWELWQRNHLDGDSHLAILESLIKGVSYLLVWPGLDPEWPKITVEDPLEVVVEYAAADRRNRLAGLKRWRNDDNRIYATLYRPEAVYKLQTVQTVSEGAELANVEWERRELEGEEWPLPNSLGVVPLVPLPNRRRLTGGIESEVAQVIPIQDAINKLLADMLIASEFAAFRQRWVTGLEIPLDEAGEPIEPFKAAVDRIWSAPPVQEGEQETKFGEFEQTDLSGYVQGIELLVQHLASRTRTPPHYLLGQSGAFPSGESLKATETGLVKKVRLKMRPLSEGLEEAMRLAFRLRGDEQRGRALVETLWQNPESRSTAETTDAALKMQTLGIPQEALWAFIGATPQEVERWRVMREEEASLVADAFAPPRGPLTAITGGLPGAGTSSPVQPAPPAASTRGRP